MISKFCNFSVEPLCLIFIEILKENNWKSDHNFAQNFLQNCSIFKCEY